ncbi:helix-turn-helix domain-containing protein [Mucilaginibacter lappiensis]|uniref:helix-turn-helix domain-containing protein n=1 Tax=Mucilaginibacter lappiensis TaxID=354630 RepID=UPI003D1D3895
MSKTISTAEFLNEQGHMEELNKQFIVFERETFACKACSYNRRDFYKISLLYGNSRLYYADRGIELNQPALVFSNPMIPSSWEPSPEDQGGYFCLFNEEFLKEKDRDIVLQESPLYKIGADPVYLLTDEQAADLDRIFQSMVKEFNSQYIHKYALLKNYVNLILHEAMKMQPAGNYFKHHNANERISTLFLELLDRQFPIDSPGQALKLKTPNQYAEYLSVHVNHLNRAVKEITGKTTTVLIAERIIKEAKALLTHTDWNIAQIAYSLGYEYPNYFNNFFKKQTGLTPRSLRIQ